MPDDLNPLLSTSPYAWDQLIESIDPASILVVIEQRMNATLKLVVAAEDIFQEALLHAWRDRQAFEWRGLASFRGWLLRIIDHRIHDAVDRNAARKRGSGRAASSLSVRHSDADTTADATELPGGSTTPSKIAAYREQAGIVRRALDELPDEVRDIVRLRLLEQCPLEEIAVRQALGLSAVRHRLRKGAEIYFRCLRAALGSKSSSPPDSATTPRRDSSGEDR